MSQPSATSTSVSPKGFDRNFWFNIAESAFINAGFTFFSVSYYLALWLTKLGVGPAILGMLSTFWFVGLSITQPYSAARARPLTHVRGYLLTWFGWQRVAIALLVVGMVVIGPDHPHVMIVLTFASVVMFTLTEGMAHPVWLQWIGKTTPLNQRGRLAGLRSSVGGLAGMGANALAIWCLARWAFPMNFTVLFSMGFLVLMGSWLCYVFMKEEAHVPPPPPPPGEGVWKKVWSTAVADVSFSKFLLSVLAVQLAILLPANFFVVYGLHGQYIQESQAGTIGMIGGFAIMVWSPLLGWLGDRFGNRWLLAVSALFGAAAAFCGWCAPGGLPWLLAASVFSGGAGISASIGAVNLILEYSPKGEEAHYTSVTIPVIGMAGMVSPLVGGFIAQGLGYPFLMASSTLLALMAAVAVWWLVLSRSRTSAPA